MIDIKVRPLGAWPGGARTEQRRRAPFTSLGGEMGVRRPIPIGQTLSQLKYELQAIDCTKAIIEASFREGDLTREGWPSARARTPDDPGVVLHIVMSKHGELSYPCDTFTTWEGNLRAITLALQALRKIDRYGVTRRGEQYTGWKALPARGTNTLTAEAAAGVIVAYSNGELDSKLATAVVKKLLESSDAARSAIRKARKATHPDANVSTKSDDLRGPVIDRTAMFQRVELAAGVLAQHFGVDKL